MTTRSSQLQARNFRLTKAKRKTLELLAEYFCLRANDIAQLLRNHEPNDNDKRTARHTLGLLHKAGLVHRIAYLEPDRESGGTAFVYGLSDSGVALMGDTLPFLRNFIKTFDEHSRRTLDHELEISFFHVALKKFSNAHGLLLHWQQRDLKKTIAPDACFAITDPKQPDGQNTLHYFLEVERAKIGNVKNGEPSIIRKLGKYHEYFNTDTCAEEWETFRKFRVIIVQRSEAKRDFLLSKLAEVYPHRILAHDRGAL